MKSKFLSPFLSGLFLLAFIANNVKAQEPTEQDCLGAITVCQDIYVEPNVFSGTGNYPNEIPVCQPCDQCCPDNCIDGEQNSVWYRFTVQESGDLVLSIDPNAPSDDYDWVLYDMTFHRCEDLPEKASQMQISCNAAGGAGYQGETGIDSNMGGVVNCNNCGETNKWNANLPVLAGRTYVLSINNWAGAGAQSGFTLDFSASTAVIYDDVRPEFMNVIASPIICGDTSFRFNFTEVVKCVTVTENSLKLSGPEEEHDIVHVTGPACEVGAEMERTYKVTVDPPFTVNGDYTLEIVPFSSISDACDNVALPQEITFTVDLGAPEIDSTNSSVANATCGEDNGFITGLEISGNGPPYFYYWVNETQDTVGYDLDLTNVASGQYTLYVEDEVGCAGSSGPYSIMNEGAPLVDDVALQTVNDTCEANMGSITGLEISGTEPITYEWVDESGQPVGDTTYLTGLSGGEYTLIITDANDCQATYGPVEILSLPAPQLDVSNVVVKNASCELQNGSISGIEVFSQYELSFDWRDENNNPLGIDSAEIHALLPGVYSLSIMDEHGCTVNAGPYEIINEGGLQIENISSDDATCENDNASIQISVSTFEDAGIVEYSINDSLSWQSDSIFENLAPGTYHIIVRDQFACYDEYGENPVIIENKGEVFQITAEGDTPLCSGDDLQLFVPENISGLGYQWSGPDGFSSPEKDPLIQNVEMANAGIYTVIATDTSYGCADTTSVEIQVEESFLMSVDLTVSKNSIYPGEEITFTASSAHANAEVYYVWYIDGVEVQSGADSTLTTTDIVANAVVYCEMHTDANCADPNPALSNEVEVSIYDIRFYLPNSFNPSSTQGNDVFRIITQAEAIPGLEFYIFDRWGQKIFESNDKDVGWDGTIRGKPAPEGVYIWLLKYEVFTDESPDGKEESKKGTVMLVR